MGAYTLAILAYFFIYSLLSVIGWAEGWINGREVRKRVRKERGAEK